MKSAQQTVSTQRLLAVSFRSIDLNPESPVSGNDLATQARALIDACLSPPPVMQLVSKFSVFFGKKHSHLIVAMTFLLVSPALSFPPSDSSFPVDRVPILLSLQTLTVCSYIIRGELGVGYPEFFHNLVPMLRSFCSFRNASRPLHSCFFSLARPSLFLLLLKY